MTDDIQTTPQYPALIAQVQDFIAEQLNTDPQISAKCVTFLPEHRLDIDYEMKAALGKQGMVGLVNVPKSQYGGHNGITTSWEMQVEIDVFENPTIRRAQMKKDGIEHGTASDMIGYVQESLCGPSSRTYGMFCPISNEVGEDSGFLVGKSLLKTYAIGEISGIVSGDTHWEIPFALQSDLSALSAQVQEISSEISGMTDDYVPLVLAGDTNIDTNGHTFTIGANPESTGVPFEVNQYGQVSVYNLYGQVIGTNQIQVNNNGDEVGLSAFNTIYHQGAGQTWQLGDVIQEYVEGIADDLQQDISSIQDDVSAIQDSLSAYIPYPILNEEYNDWEFKMAPQDVSSLSRQVVMGSYEESIPGEFTTYIKLGDNARIITNRESPTTYNANLSAQANIPRLKIGSNWIPLFRDLPKYTSQLTNDSGYPTYQNPGHFIKYDSYSGHPDRWYVNFGKSSTGGLTFCSDECHPTQSYIDIAGTKITPPGYDPDFDPDLSSREVTRRGVRDADNHLQYGMKPLAYVEDVSASYVDLTAYVDSAIQPIVNEIEEVSASLSAYATTTQVDGLSTAIDTLSSYADSISAYADSIQDDLTAAMSSTTDWLSAIQDDVIDLSAQIAEADNRIDELSANQTHSLIRRWEEVTLFTIKTRSANNTISTVAQGSPDQQSLEYSTDDGETWSDFTLGSTSVTLSNVGDTLQIRAKTSNSTIAKTWQNYWKIAATEDFDVEGSMNSLLRNDPRTDATSLAGAFFGLFEGNTHLIDASKLILPWTDISTSTSASKFEAMFRNCTSLTTPPALPATTIDSYCYKAMFRNCTSLATAPTLPAMSIPQEAYHEMFYGCTALTVAPALPATTLTAYENYRNMFKYCSALTTPPPALPATIVPDRAYQGMFENCTSLTTPPTFSALEVGNNSCGGMFGNSGLTTPMQIPTTTVGVGGFYGTFYGTSITTAPSLPATSVPQNGYREMFYGCTGLESVELSVQTIGDYAFANIFQGCTSLKTANLKWLSSAGDYALNSAFRECSSLVTVDFSNATAVPAMSNIDTFADTNNTYKVIVPDSLYDTWVAATNWSDPSVKPHIIRESDTIPALRFTAKQANSTIAMQAVGSAPSVSLEYSTDDGSTWNTFTVGSTTITLANVGDTAYMRAGSNGNTAFASNYDVYNKFVMSGSIACSGNINYLLNQNGEEPQGGLAQWTFSYLFNGCTSLTSAPELPATTTNAHSYQFMFSGCTSLTTPPSSLPALNIPEGAYGDMFSGCTSLTSAPTILAGWVQTYACHSMFRGCSSLTIAPSMSSLVYVAEQGLYRMFHSCTALATPPTLPATTILRECYYQMFWECSSLTSAPELPATTLANNCYQEMFYGCTSLTTAPELPATTLVSMCYHNMFKNCSSLNEIKIAYTGNFSGTGVPTYAFAGWVNGVAASGTFYYNGSDTTTGISKIPEGWTVQTFS